MGSVGSCPSHLVVIALPTNPTGVRPVKKVARDIIGLFSNNVVSFSRKVGVTVKPPLPKPFAGLLISPEVRYDQALTSRFKPFEQNTSHNQVTLAIDVVLEF
jgi:hypothetical protein